MLPVQPQPAGLPSGTIGGRRRGRAAAWAVAGLWRSPHRLAFSLGAMALVAGLLWWSGCLLADVLGVPLRWAVPSGLAQALLFGAGVLPLFLAGLALAMAPLWLDVAEPRTRTVGAPLGMQAAGWALAVVGFHLSGGVAALGLTVAALGQLLLAGRVAVLWLESPVSDREHVRTLAWGLSLGALGLWGVALALALGQPGVARAAFQAALWAGSGWALLALGHRVSTRFVGVWLPAMATWQARALLRLLALLLAMRAVFEAAEVLRGGALVGGAAALCAVVETCGGLLLTWLAWRWGLRYSLGAALQGHSLQGEDAHGEPVLAGPARLRLLAMLHLGFAWLGVALTLGAVSHAVMALSDGALSLGRAPLLAFGMGFMGSTLLALATRLSLQHSGRPLAADVWTWALAWVVQAGVVFVVLGALFPAAAERMNWLAAQFWGLAGLSWAVRHLRWWGRPRLDATRQHD